MTILASPSPSKLFQGEDAVDFVAFFVQPTPGATAATRPFNKGFEYAVLCGVGLLLVVVWPDIFDD
jgi:hypothetical protein